MTTCRAFFTQAVTRSYHMALNG